MNDLGVWGKATSPYHRGERALHQRYGRLEEQTLIARRIHAPNLDASQAAFLERLEYVVVASIDQGGRPWASMLFGPSGFAHAPDASTIEIETLPVEGDRLHGNMVAGSPMSIVAIELATRRRIRANVTFRGASQSGLRFSVDQAYGNCPKYIQTRTLNGGGADASGDGGVIERIDRLSGRPAAIIRKADTFFVASYNNEDDQHDVGGVDVNHRGGRPGFVGIDGDKLIIPDYSGNFAFNTLGNFLINPVAGLLFVDFVSGDLLQITGRAEILWEDDPKIRDFPGAKRGWSVDVEEGSLLRNAIAATWDFGDFSPSLARTGTWDEVPDQT